MPPRGRPRTGLKRIDAAIDAMLPLGFTIKQVRKCVKELLKEYGGDEQWPFIEDGAYRELIAALLRDSEKESQEELALDANHILQDQKLLKEKSSGEEEPAVTYEGALDTLADEVSPTNNVAVAEPVLGILPDQTLALVEEAKNKEDPPKKEDSPRFQTALPTKRKKQQWPCYGWIEEEDEDEEEDGDDFITLPRSSMVLGPPKARKYPSV